MSDATREELYELLHTRFGMDTGELVAALDARYHVRDALGQTHAVAEMCECGHMREDHFSDGDDRDGDDTRCMHGDYVHECERYRPEPTEGAEAGPKAPQSTSVAGQAAPERPVGDGPCARRTPEARERGEHSGSPSGDWPDVFIDSRDGLTISSLTELCWVDG